MTEHRLSSARVLVVDDDQMNLELVRRLLTQLGVGDVRVVSRADALDELVVTYDPDLILLDHHVGRVDGIDAVIDLTASDPRWRSRQVVLISGDVDPAVRSRAGAAGIARVLEKPYTAERFRETVTRALRGPIDDTKSEGEAQARRDLLSHMNHELRTPLTTILGFAELLSTSDLDEQQREWNASVIRAARRLRTILDETLQQ